MTARPRLWWQQIKQHPVASILAFIGSALVISLIIVVVLGYRLNWHWTGLVPETSEPQQHAKTLWDWLQLLAVLAIPVVVGLGAAWYTAQQGKVSDRENSDNQREAALQAYIDKISELLLKEHLGERTADGQLKPEYEQVRKIARVRTITILTQLDARRIGYVFTFLREPGLMSATSNDNAVSLVQADLRAVNWSGADLSGADLREANLYKANLFGADLREANLINAHLRDADLREANLRDANLSGASLGELIMDIAPEVFGVSKSNLSKSYLYKANLSGADLSGAILDGADFTRAIVTEDQLEKAKSYKGTTKTDGTKYPET